MRRWSSGLRRGPPDTPASVWTVASQQLLRWLKRADAWKGQEGEEGGRTAVVWLSSARNTRGAALTHVLYSMLRKVEGWSSFMMLGLCYGLWWEREAHRKQGRGVKLRDLRRNLANFNRRDEEEQIWPRLWRQKKRRWQRMWGAPRWSQRSWREMKRIVIKRERGGEEVQGTFREASYRWRADTFWEKGKTFQEER